MHLTDDRLKTTAFIDDSYNSFYISLRSTLSFESSYAIIVQSNTIYYLNGYLNSEPAVYKCYVSGLRHYPMMIEI